MSVVKVSLSCGKDSLTSVFLHLFDGNEVKAVTYIPYFTDNIPLILKRDYDFILYVLDLLSSYGVSVFLVKGITYLDYVLSISRTTGLIKGFPCPINQKCGFKRDSKDKALSSIDVGPFDYLDIGIAFDEIKRHNQLNSFKRSILFEKEVCEHQCFDFCKKNGLLLPSYSVLKRNGCCLCYNASPFERMLWYRDYPEAYDILRFLQEYVISARPERLPLRNGNLFFDPLQLELDVI